MKHMGGWCAWGVDEQWRSMCFMGGCHAWEGVAQWGMMYMGVGILLPQQVHFASFS